MDKEVLIQFNYLSSLEKQKKSQEYAYYTLPLFPSVLLNIESYTLRNGMIFHMKASIKKEKCLASSSFSFKQFWFLKIVPSPFYP